MKTHAGFAGKLALVTGSSQGIGRAIALGFAGCGTDVAINYSTSADAAEPVRAAAAELGVQAAAVQCDVADERRVIAMFETVKRTFSRPPDILVNNAGTLVAKSTVADMPRHLWDRVLAINLTGAMLCARAAIPGMKAGRWGRIINVTSISGRSGGGPGGAHYAAAKAGLISLTRSLAKELAAHAITVNAVVPGVILTAIHEKFNTPEALEQLKDLVPLGDLGQPQDCVGAVLFLAGEDARYITGAEIAINGGMRMD